jgi:hypothetical protein
MNTNHSMQCTPKDFSIWKENLLKKLTFEEKEAFGFFFSNNKNFCKGMCLDMKIQMISDALSCTQ